MMSQVTDNSNQSIFHMWLTTLKFDIDKHYLIYTTVELQAYVVSKPPGYNKSRNISQHAYFIFVLHVLPRMYVFLMLKYLSRVGQNKYPLHLSFPVSSLSLTHTHNINTHSERIHDNVSQNTSLPIEEICKGHCINMTSRSTSH